MNNLGGIYGGATIIRSRLLPLLGQSGVLNGDFGLSSAAQAIKDQELNDIQDMYERSLLSLQADLDSYKTEAEELKQRWSVLTKICIIFNDCCCFLC